MDELLHRPTSTSALCYRFFSLLCDTLYARVCIVMPLVASRLIVSAHIEALSYKERFGWGFSPIKGFPRVNTCVYCG